MLLLVLSLVSVLTQIAGGCGGYGWRQMDDVYYVAERGRNILLVEVQVQKEGAFFNPIAKVLVEPCGLGASKEERPDDLPCWPSGRPPQELLAQIYTRMPDYRQKSVVEHAARYLNREIGQFREAWIVGTSPLAVAFLQAPPVGRPEPLGRVGQRNARFVTEPDLDAQANVLLLFPRELVLAVDGLPGTERVDGNERAKVFSFEQPQTIRSLIETLTAPPELERQARSVVEVPVKRE